MNQAIMAHIVASITVFVNAPPLYLPYAIANARIAPMPCSQAREWRPTGHVFLASFMSLLPIRGDLLYLIRIRSITDRTNPGYCV